MTNVDNDFQETMNTMQLTHIDFVMDVCAPICQTRITQTFVNHSDDIVEATYQFPVPKSASVSDVVVSINDKVYTSQVTEKSQAQAQYEEGIESGKRAVLLQIQDDGVYELIIGNVAPYDRIEIAFNISQLLTASHNGYQYILPTMVAPKYEGYGSVDRNKGLYQSITEYSFFAQYPFTATINNHIGTVRSVSHVMSVTSENQMTMSGLLDKNIVFYVESLPAQPYALHSQTNDSISSVLTIPASIISLDDVPFDDEYVTSLCFVVDCSGSMMGSSIAQLREGLIGLISELDEHSELSLICFGTNTKCHTPRPMRMNHQNKEALLDIVSTLSASMGGTNIFSALDEAQAQAQKHDHAPQIIVLTDGWVNQYDKQLTRISKQSPFPIHSVGIGSGANDDFILALSEACQGETCFVHPNENMVHVISHFIKSVSLPKEEIAWQVPKHTFADLPKRLPARYLAVGLLLSNVDANNPAKSFKCAINDTSHTFESMSLPDTLSDTLVKVVGSHYIRNLKKDHAQDALAMTIKLGIITEDVSCVMVSDEVVEGADGLPEQVNIPQMTPDMMVDIPSYSVQSSACASEPEEYLAIPSFLRRSSDESPADSIPMFIRTKSKYKDLLENVNAKMTRLLNRSTPTLNQLDTWGLPTDIFEWLESIASSNNKAYLQACIAVVILRFDSKEKILSNSAKEKLLAIKQREFPKHSVALTKVETSIEKLFAELS